VLLEFRYVMPCFTGVEEQLLCFARPNPGSDGNVQHYPSGKCIPAFQTLYARYLSVYGDQQQQQQPNDVVMANLYSPSACMVSAKLALGE
jgi:hypothetical protein